MAEWCLWRCEGFEGRAWDTLYCSVGSVVVCEVTVLDMTFVKRPLGGLGEGGAASHQVPWPGLHLGARCRAGTTSWLSRPPGA